MKSSFFDCFYVMPHLKNGGHYTDDSLNWTHLSMEAIYRFRRIIPVFIGRPTWILQGEVVFYIINSETARRNLNIRRRQLVISNLRRSDEKDEDAKCFVCSGGGRRICFITFFFWSDRRQAFIFRKGLLLPEQIVSAFLFFRLFTTFRNGCVVCREVLFPDLSPIKTSFGLYRLFMF